MAQVARLSAPHILAITMSAHTWSKMISAHKSEGKSAKDDNAKFDKLFKKYFIFNDFSTIFKYQQLRSTNQFFFQELD